MAEHKTELAWALRGADELRRQIGAGERDHSRSVVLTQQKPGETRGEEAGPIEFRGPGARAVVGDRRTGIDDDVKAHVRFLHVTFDAETVAARIETPVEVT